MVVVTHRCKPGTGQPRVKGTWQGEGRAGDVGSNGRWRGLESTDSHASTVEDLIRIH
jgi:hypothetical protein